MIRTEQKIDQPLIVICTLLGIIMLISSSACLQEELIAASKIAPKKPMNEPFGEGGSGGQGGGGSQGDGGGQGGGGAVNEFLSALAALAQPEPTDTGASPFTPSDGLPASKMSPLTEEDGGGSTVAKNVTPKITEMPQGKQRRSSVGGSTSPRSRLSSPRGLLSHYGGKKRSSASAPIGLSIYAKARERFSPEQLATISGEQWDEAGKKGDAKEAMEFLTKIVGAPKNKPREDDTTPTSLPPSPRAPVSPTAQQKPSVQPKQNNPVAEPVVDERGKNSGTEAPAAPTGISAPQGTPTEVTDSTSATEADMKAKQGANGGASNKRPGKKKQKSKREPMIKGTPGEEITPCGSLTVQVVTEERSCEIVKKAKSGTKLKVKFFLPKSVKGTTYEIRITGIAKPIILGGKNGITMKYADWTIGSGTTGTQVVLTCNVIMKIKGEEMANQPFQPAVCLARP